MLACCVILTIGFVFRGLFVDHCTNAAVCLGCSYVASDGTQLVKVDNVDDAPVSLVNGGLELVVRSDSADGKASKTIGSRELFRYYKQRPPPSDQRDGIAVNAVIAKCDPFHAFVVRHCIVGPETSTLT